MHNYVYILPTQLADWEACICEATSAPGNLKHVGLPTTEMEYTLCKAMLTDQLRLERERERQFLMP